MVFKEQEMSVFDDIHVVFINCSYKFTSLFLNTRPYGPSVIQHMSRVVRNPAFCICESKDANQLRGDREADQLLCFRYMGSAIPLLSKSEISSL